MKDNNKTALLGKTIEELKAIVHEHGWPGFVARQLSEWLYHHHASHFDEMTNLSKKIRKELSSLYTIGCQDPIDVQTSSDGTKKYLFPVSSGGHIEAVYIPDGKRHTLCISSQAGCRMGCRFCMTARQGLQGQLSPGEIINQVRSIPERGLITNIVFMGMGEPLDNLDAVLASLNILTGDHGFAMSPRRITVSTIGILPEMDVFLRESRCHLAISMHSPFDEERQKLVPMEKKHPVRSIIAALKKHDIENQRRVSVEYIVFKGINHTQGHAEALARLLKDIRCRINLIRFHPIPGSNLEMPADQEMQTFKEALENKGLITTIRRSRGRDIDAACGLLSTKTKKRRDKQKVSHSKK